MEEEAEIPIDVLAHVFTFIDSFIDLAQASRVCRKWKEGVIVSLARRNSLSFAGLKMDDPSITRIIQCAHNLKELDISSCPGLRKTTNKLLHGISSAKCIGNLTSVSLWGMIGISDDGVIPLISGANSLQHLNVGGTFITDKTLLAIADCCPHLRSIVLWSCCDITEIGVIYLVNKCGKLERINAWGTRVPTDCFSRMLTDNPGLRVKQGGFLLDIGSASLLPVA